ncbi:MAG: DUF302 domain-containing protein [Deferrisomatales bacterium]|nr:DUF302 domain-containing protein [Deferrisomatales bacterium]
MKRSLVLAVLAILAVACVAGAFEYDYTVATDKSVDATLDDVKSAIRREGLRIPGVLDLPTTYDYVLVQVCDPEEVKVLGALDPKLGLLCPCGKIGVYADPLDGGRTKISLLLPEAGLVRVHPTDAVRAVAEKLLPRLMRVVEGAR